VSICNSAKSLLLSLCILASNSFLPVHAEKLNKVSLNEELKLEPIKIQDFFYKAHIEKSNYQPLTLDSVHKEPILITLADVLEQAVANNLNLNIAKFDSKIAKWRFWEQFSENLPSFTMNVSKFNQEGTFFINPQLQGPIDQNIAQTNLEFRHRIFNGGTTLFMTIAENYYKKAVKFDEQSSYNQTLLNSVTLYNNLLSSKLSIIAQLKLLKSNQTNYERSLKLFKLGTGTKLDTLLAKASVENAQTALTQAEAQFRNSEIELAKHLYLPLNTAFEVNELNPNELTASLKKIELNEFLDTAFSNNPAIQSQLALRKNALHQGIAKVGNFLPKVDIYYRKGYNGTEFSNLNNIDTLGVDASLEVGRNMGLGHISDLMASKNMIDKAKLQYSQQLQTIEESLRKAFVEYQQASSALTSYKAELESSKEALRLSKLRYDNGLGLFTELIEQEKEFTDASVAYIKSIANLNNSKAKLSYNMGTINLDELLAYDLTKK
jgi:OMF family outer membrane factor